MAEVEKLKKAVDNAEAQFTAVEETIQGMRHSLKSKFQELLDQHMSSQVDWDYVAGFFEEPYVMIPKKGNQWFVIVPKWLKMQVGYLEHSTKSFNVFIVTKYTQWLGEIPQALKDKLKFPSPLPFKVYDGMLYTGTAQQELGWQRYRKYLQNRKGKDQIRIRKGYEFKLIAQLIEDGTLPFMPIPLAEDDQTTWTGVGCDRYRQICKKQGITQLQNKTWQTFQKHGAIGVYWASGTGKSLFGHRLIGNIKGTKLVVIPSLTLKEQWLERLAYFNPEQTEEEVRVETYHSYHKVKNKPWTLTIFDECQHLPATTFIRLGTLNTKYRVGFSASPFREDGRENYIFALTGYPVGMAWEDLLTLGIIRAPQFRLYIVANKKDKEKKLEELLRIPIKTLVFCDSIDYGQYLKEKFEIPFVWSETTGRLNIIRNSQTCIVSRVGDEGISDPNLERSIEVAFLFGSRMQESQRFGRLMHSHKKAQHIIIMTSKEYELYQKRLNVIVERGFKIEYVVSK